MGHQDAGAKGRSFAPTIVSHSPNLIRDTTPGVRRVPAHPEHALPNGAQNIFAFGYLSRAAGRLSEVFNWGN